MGYRTSMPVNQIRAILLAQWLQLVQLRSVYKLSTTANPISINDGPRNSIGYDQNNLTFSFLCNLSQQSGLSALSLLLQTGLQAQTMAYQMY